MKATGGTMTVEQLAERMPDRSQQVLGLLNELSERLRKSENERDALKRELLVIRDSIQDLDDRNSQTQKALLAFENKFDGTETNVEVVMRRLTGMEETVDRQSGELLGILRKIEERFESYDREYKNHVANIEQYGDTLDRFDKKLEKLMQDKGRISRKLDAMEFQLADTEERLQSGRPMVMRDITNPNLDETTARSNLLVWSPETAKPQFMNGPNEIPQPRFKNFPTFKISPHIWQYLSVGLLVVLLAALAFGVIYSLLRHPGTVDSPSSSPSPQVSSTTDEGVSKLDEPVKTSATAISLPEKNFFSQSVRHAMDQQIVAARKIEDDDTARLMAMADPAPLQKKITRDTRLPRAIQAIERNAFDGNVETQRDMGALYSSGQSGVDIDYARAAQWFRVAAENGNANARYNLGVLYQQGLGVEKDVDQALSWYRGAALLEHPEARYNLGIAYFEGIGVPYNPAMAAGYFEQAARAGVIEAAYNLGMILENGLIDEARIFEAVFWYKLALEGGSEDAKLAYERLLKDQNMSETDATTLFDRMIGERPDLKALADSRQGYLDNLNQTATAPNVRIHTPQNKNSSLVSPPTEKITPQINNQPESAPSTVTNPRSNLNEHVIEGVQPTSLKPATKPNVISSLETADPQMVARIQTMLSDESLYKGRPDGQMGPATADAIRRYQTKYGLTVNGEPSTSLMAQMLARRLAVTAEPAAGNRENTLPPPAPSIPNGSMRVND